MGSLVFRAAFTNEPEARTKILAGVLSTGDNEFTWIGKNSELRLVKNSLVACWFSKLPC